MKRVFIKLLETYIFLFLGLCFVGMVYVAEATDLNPIVPILLFVIFVPLVFGMVIIQISNNDMLVEIKNSLKESNTLLRNNAYTIISNEEDAPDSKWNKNNKSVAENINDSELHRYDIPHNEDISLDSLPLMDLKDIAEDGPFRIRNKFDQVTTGTFKNGELDGLFEQYYKNGRLKLKCHYENGNCEGTHETFYADGSLERKDTYKNGILLKK